MADNGLGYITELNAMDVLFGRGSGPNDHEGNIRFRHLVAERKDEYLATNHRQTKAKIARDIVNTILNEQGRFLKKVEHFEARRLGIPKGLDAWIIVDDDTVMEKAKQALRQNTAKEKGRGNSPVRGGANSPYRGNSPVRGVSPSRSPMANNRLPQQQQAMPHFQDLEPLPMGFNNNNNSVGVVGGGPFAGMSLQEQQQRIQQQVQQQVAAQQQQQQQITAAAQLAALSGVDVNPTPLAWGAGSSDHHRFAPNPNVLAAGTADWGGGSNHGVVLPGQEVLSGGGGWAQQQQDALQMAPPNNPNNLGPGQVQYSNNNNNNNWGTNSEHTAPRGNTLPSDNNNWGANSEHTAPRGNLGRLPRGDPDMDDSHQRRKSLQVEDLMDSFSKLQTGNFSDQAKLQESTDTMGTIEPIGGGEFGNSAMSVTSFSSSTFSIFKSAMGDSTDEFALSRGVSRSSSINEGVRRDSTFSNIDASMASMQSIGSSMGNMSEVWGSRGMSLLDRLVQEERERAGGGEGGDGGGGSAEDTTGNNNIAIAETPRPVGLMEEEPDNMNLNSLGASSISVLKAAAFDSNRSDDEQDAG